jgi:two-component system invasion response regulator UvrY
LTFVDSPYPQPALKKIRLFLVDDHRMMVDMWTALLSSDPRFEVLGYTVDGNTAMELIRQHQPQVILMDITLPGKSGIELTKLIKEEWPGMRVLAVSMHNNTLLIKQILTYGASGFVSKTSGFEEMSQAILKVAEGQRFISEDIKELITAQTINPDFESPAAKLNDLTKREMEVVEMLREGLSSKQIAERLFISNRTVEVHRYNIFRKLKVSNVVSLIKLVNEQRY